METSLPNISIELYWRSIVQSERGAVPSVIQNTSKASIIQVTDASRLVGRHDFPDGDLQRSQVRIF